MTRPIHPGMAEISRLMRAGQLDEATRMIRATLGGADAAQPAPQPAPFGMAGLPGAGLSGLPRSGPGLSGGPLSGMALPAMAQGRAGTKAPTPDLPDGASWTWRHHQAAGQSREVRLYRPATITKDRAPAGLLLLLHGCTQDPDDFAAGTGILEAADRHRLIVVAPGQPTSANMNRCWTWFDPRHAAREGGEAAFLADLTRSVAADFAIPPERRFAAGLSAGGAMAVILGAVFPDDFGAVACHSGLPNGAARDMGGAFQAMSQGGSDLGAGVGCRLFVLHGSADRTVSPRNAQGVVAQALRRQPGLARRAADARLEGHATSIARYRDAQGRLIIESWQVEGLGHAWSGGAPQGSHTAPGPSATQAMIRFFLTEA